VRRDDLTQWLGQQLGLRWTHAEAPRATERPRSAPARAPAHNAPPAPAHELAPLLELVRLGYYKGIVMWLDDWVIRRPEQVAFAQGLRTLARDFRFEAIEQRLLQADADPLSTRPT
jgi:hypothetical protein